MCLKKVTSFILVVKFIAIVFMAFFNVCEVSSNICYFIIDIRYVFFLILPFFFLEQGGSFLLHLLILFIFSKWKLCFIVYLLSFQLILVLLIFCLLLAFGLFYYTFSKLLRWLLGSQIGEFSSFLCVLLVLFLPISALLILIPWILYSHSV